jgi:hypothetical protein
VDLFGSVEGWFGEVVRFSDVFFGGQGTTEVVISIVDIFNCIFLLPNFILVFLIQTFRNGSDIIIIIRDQCRDGVGE